MNVRDAALVFRTPDEFELLLSALESADGDSLRVKLDCALSKVASENYSPTQMERNLSLELAATYEELIDHLGDSMDDSRSRRVVELREIALR